MTVIVRNRCSMLMLAVVLLATSSIANGRSTNNNNKKGAVKGAHYRVRNGNRKGGVKGDTQQVRRKLPGEPDVNNIDMSLFREHEEGFPGGLFYEDAQGEADLQQMVPQWRQVSKGKGGKGTGGAKGSKGSKGGSWKTKPSCKEWKSKAPSYYVGKASTKTPSYYVGKASKSKKDPYCSEAPSAVPSRAPTPVPVVPTLGLPPLTSAKGSKGGSLYSAKGSSSKGGTSASWDAGDAQCTAIANSNNLQSGGPPIAFNDPNLKFDADFRIKSRNNVNVVALLDKYSRYARLYVLGCFDEATLELRSIVQRRRLITEPLFQATMNNWSEESSSCTGSSPKTCNYNNEITTYYENSPNDVPNDREIKERVKEALKVIAYELEANPDIDKVEVESVAVARAVNGSSEAESSDTKTIIGATAGALALLMLLMFLVKRNRNDDEVSHLKFEDDDETFVREFESDASRENGRKAHIVGESDSVMSGWTGYSMDDEYSQNSDNSGKLGHTKGDVHMCSSATCEVCERKRQQGVFFIKTSTPPTPTRPSPIPNNATREYVAEDVVAL